MFYKQGNNFNIIALSIQYLFSQIGQTPLIYAVIEQHVPVIDLLIEGGADVNYGNKLHSDWAAIHWAALTDNKLVNMDISTACKNTKMLQVVESVLKSDKVRNVKDRSGRYPVQLAREHGKHSVVNSLDKIKKQ